MELELGNESKSKPETQARKWPQNLRAKNESDKAEQEAWKAAVIEGTPLCVWYLQQRGKFTRSLNFIDALIVFVCVCSCSTVFSGSVFSITQILQLTS